MPLTVFHKLTEQQFENINIESLELEKSDVLFSEGETINYLYYVVKGELNIFKNNQHMWQANPNEFIGLSSFFTDDSNYSYTVTACTNSDILKIPLDDFKNAIENSNTLNTELMKLFCVRIKNTIAKTKSHSALSKKKRLIALLIQKSIKSNQQNNITLNYSPQDIASFINTPQKVVQKILLELQNKKLLKFSKNEIDILDYNGLKLVLKMKMI